MKNSRDALDGVIIRADEIAEIQLKQRVQGKEVIGKTAPVNKMRIKYDTAVFIPGSHSVQDAVASKIAEHGNPMHSRSAQIKKEKTRNEY